MAIEHAILGLLDWQPLSGYDLKKIIANSATYYWSGNNNQIYKTLLSLQREGCVEQAVAYKGELPAKKVYTITGKGKSALVAWLKSMPEPPELHSAFLIQLTWADLLDQTDLLNLVDRYIEEVEIQLKMQREERRRGAAEHLAQTRTTREAFLWEKVAENTLLYYEGELCWANSVRQGLARWDSTMAVPPKSAVAS
jgi:DNA-binding PadR family transcriptional regulator